MRAGRLDRIVIIQQKAVSQDTYGEEIETWTTLDTVWAGRKDFRGKEYFAAQQTAASVSAVYTIRYRTDITPDEHRISDNGRIYDIKSVIELCRKVGLELMVEARAE